jgi:ADP-heptose:LPS heptosyltransferase
MFFKSIRPMYDAAVFLGRVPATRGCVSRSGGEVKRILCIHLDNLGDVLMTTPAGRALRERAPGRHLTLLGSRAGAAFAPFFGDIHDVIEYNAPLVATTKAPSLAENLRMTERLRQRAFDAAVIFTVYSRNPMSAAMMCLFAGIPRRLADCRENQIHSRCSPIASPSSNHSSKRAMRWNGNWPC